MEKKYPTAINDPVLSGAERLAALRSFEAQMPNEATRNFPRSCAEINNHIHTIYSFSPYTPAMAALLARDARLGAAGSVDHDSIAAAREMLDACTILGIGGCVGFEVRVSFNNGSFAKRKMNNPDSTGCVYMTVQGIPTQSIPKAAEFLAPVRDRRLKRNRQMTISLNALLNEAGFSEIDFDNDVCARSKYNEGGGITERHLLLAMADKIILKCGKGQGIVDGLKTKFGIKVSAKLNVLLSQPDNPHYQYDLLGVLKSEFLPEIFIQPDENECIPARTVTAFAESIAAIPAYAYLGDVNESPTGDKKPEKFEDDFIEELFAEISRLGYKAVTYMPPRNTLQQLSNLRRLCAEWGFMEISGVDINSSRQPLNCPLVLQDEFRHLLDTTWALIAHERLTSVDERYALFSDRNPFAGLDLTERLNFYAGIGKKINFYDPYESAAALAAEIEKGGIINV